MEKLTHDEYLRHDATALAALVRRGEVQPAGLLELARAQAGIAVMAVSCQAGIVRHDGVAALGDAVEQRGLAHVGAPDDGDDAAHGAV